MWSIADSNRSPRHCQCRALARWANTPIKRCGLLLPQQGQKWSPAHQGTTNSPHPGVRRSLPFTLPWLITADSVLLWLGNANCIVNFLCQCSFVRIHSHKKACKITKNFRYMQVKYMFWGDLNLKIYDTAYFFEEKVTSHPLNRVSIRF